MLRRFFAFITVNYDKIKKTPFKTFSLDIFSGREYSNSANREMGKRKNLGGVLKESERGIKL
jgi:hypothetical protein